MKSFLMNPRMAEVLSELCDEETVATNLAALSDLQDFVIENSKDDERQTLDRIYFLHGLRKMYTNLQQVLSMPQNN